MSYITIPRLAFTGKFQADVSTVNNDVRHFDIETFESRFQTKSEKVDEKIILNGWWNPDGTNAMRFSDLQVHEALSEYGADPNSDPATGLYLNAQYERSSAKLVDLDPQMQVVSTIFGLRLVLTDGKHNYLSGYYKAAPFRDLMNGRPGKFMSAQFTSVLTDLQWSDKCSASPTLTALKKIADENDNKLSVNLTTTRISGIDGLIAGSIGAYIVDQPELFVAGRRLVQKPKVLGDLTADINGDVLSMDFSNSIGFKFDSTGNIKVDDMGDLYMAVLRKSDIIHGVGSTSGTIELGFKRDDSLSLSDIKLLNQINYSSENFLDKKAGLADSQLDDEALALISDHPVAIVKKEANGSYTVISRETNGGFYARADKFVHRLDPPFGDDSDSDNDINYAHESINFNVTQWGKPVSGVPIKIVLEGTARSGKYWGSAAGDKQPKAPYPNMNTPSSKVKFSNGITSNSGGWATMPLKVWNPGNPRGYVDGQIYTIRYQVSIANASVQAPFDLIVLHVREAQNYPSPPDWDNSIAPFMQQYDNLYPVMSKHLFSLSDPEVFEKNAQLLTLAFKLPIDDPNHMPVTRDLSNAKRQAVLDWLAQYTKNDVPIVMSTQPDLVDEIVENNFDDMPSPESVSIEALQAIASSLDDELGGKDHVIKSFIDYEIKNAEAKKED